MNVSPEGVSYAVTATNGRPLGPAFDDMVRPTGPDHLRVAGRGILALVNPTRLKRVLEKLFDESEFLSPYGIRSVSRYHQDDPQWREYLNFFEYFNADSGVGLGASHQTGWTSLVAGLIQLFGGLDSKTLLESGKLGLYTPTTYLSRVS
jgi:hypothetical protein